MKLLLVLATLIGGAPAFAEPAANIHYGDAPATRICALFPHRRDGSRRICLTATQWQARLGPDWRQLLTGRNAEDDLAVLGPRTRARPELPPDCLVCPQMPPPRTD